VLLLPRAVPAVRGPTKGVVTKAEQGRLVDRGYEPDVPAVAAVPAVGPTPVDMGLPSPGHRSCAPVAGARVELSLIDETCHFDPA
jgi:hypothetical protein